MCCCARSCCENEQSAESGRAKGESNCAETALGSEELRLAQQVLIGLRNNLVGGVVGGGNGLEARVVPLIDAAEAVARHFVMY